MNKIEIAIPSYKRVETLQNKTLEYLYQTNAWGNRITVFVADRLEAELYNKAIQAMGNGRYSPKVVVGKLGIMEQRNFIRRYYPQGTKVFSMDDDVAGLYRALTPKKGALLTDLQGLMEEGFSYCDQFNGKLWGVSAVLNWYFMYGKSTSFNLKYVVGAAFGQIIDHSKKLNQTMHDKGDYERSIKYYHYFGSTIRFNEVAVKTNYYKEKGGMQETRTEARVVASGRRLLKEWPQYCMHNTAKKNHFEIKLHHKK